MSAGVKTPVLLNAAEMARLFPETFSRPDETVLRQLRMFDFAKVCMPCEGTCFGGPTFGERFWCEIIFAEYPFFTGRIDNKLVTTKALRYDDLIRFHSDNIYAVQDCCDSLPKVLVV